jgi:hypothetical protein
VALSEEKPGEGGGVAVSDDPQGLSGVTVDDHGHIPLTPPQRRLVDQQDPTATATPIRSHPI